MLCTTSTGYGIDLDFGVGEMEDQGNGSGDEAILGWKWDWEGNCCSLRVVVLRMYLLVSSVSMAELLGRARPIIQEGLFDSTREIDCNQNP